jgi:uncharacterized delta-60 repeat protein
MSARVFGLSSAAGASYWIATLGGANTDTGNGIAVDSSGNIHVVGTTDSAGTGSSDILVTKYDTLGAISWQRVLGAATADEGYGIALDSSGGVYITGIQNANSGSSDITIAKYTALGAYSWQRRLAGVNSDEGRGITVTAAGDVFVVGPENSTTNIFIAKYNTSGTFAWAKSLNNTGGLDIGYGVSVDSSGNAYLVGQSINAALIAKYDTSGAVSWQSTLSGSGSNDFRAIAVDSSGNACVTGARSGGNLLIARWLAAGTLDWQGTVSGVTGTGAAIDASGNCYVSGTTTSSAEAFVAKYNISGALQWQRVLNGSSSDFGYGVSVDNAGSVYVTGQTYSSGAGGADVLIFKVPDDGSLTGTYGAFTYSVSTLTATTSSLTAAGSSLVNSTSALSDVSGALTSGTSTLTSTVTTI